MTRILHFPTRATDSGTLIEAATEANKRGMHLITNGRDIRISPIVPQGWNRMGAAVKKPSQTTARLQRCWLSIRLHLAEFNSALIEQRKQIIEQDLIDAREKEFRIAIRIAGLPTLIKRELP